MCKFSTHYNFWSYRIVPDKMYIKWAKMKFLCVKERTNKNKGIAIIRMWFSLKIDPASNKQFSKFRLENKEHKISKLSFKNSIFKLQYYSRIHKESNFYYPVKYTIPFKTL